MNYQAGNVDDKMLIAAFRQEGSREAAFTQLVHKYQERLYWHIRRMVVNHSDADDVLQNVLIKVWRHLAGFKEEANLYTWLYRIATNETVSWLEQQKKHAAAQVGEDYMQEQLVAQNGYDPNKIEWKLQQAIATLPQKQRVVFNLRYYDEMPYEDMADVLETSAGALKASYHHAAKKIEAFLKQD